MRHKETFSQAAHEGLPPHIVVQYWDDSNKLQASYFNSWEDVEHFEHEIEDQKNDR